MKSKLHLVVISMIIISLITLLVGCSFHDNYQTLLTEAKRLSSELRPRSHSIEEVKSNIEKRAALKRRADTALEKGWITRSQYDEIVRTLRRTGRRQ